MSGDSPVSQIIEHGSTLQKREGGYSKVLPPNLELHYDEEDPEVLHLRKRAALLDAMLKDTLSKMGKEGIAVNLSLIRENLRALLPYATDVASKQYIDNIETEISRVTNEEALQIKARKIISELTEVVKTETSRLVAIGGALTIPQIGGLVNGIVTISLQFMASKFHSQYADDKDRARAFIQIIRRNVISTPGMPDIDQLSQAANVPFVKSMGAGEETPRRGETLD